MYIQLGPVCRGYTVEHPWEVALPVDFFRIVCQRIHHTLVGNLVSKLHKQLYTHFI